jgi:hypothetical protein
MSYYRPEEYLHNPHWAAMRKYVLSGKYLVNYGNYGTGQHAAFSPGYATANHFYAAQLRRAGQIQNYHTGTLQEHADKAAFQNCTNATNFPQACAQSLNIAPPTGDIPHLHYRYGWN